jgi:hypothetical protein
MLRQVYLGQVVEALPDLDVVGAQQLCGDLQRALVLPLGLGVAARGDRAFNPND